MTNSINTIVKGAAAKYTVPESLIRAVIQTESNFKSGIKTPEYKKDKAGKEYLYGYSYGLMQILDKTGRLFGIKDPELLRDDTINIYTGTEHLRNLLKNYKGNISDTVAAYNAGRKKFKNGKLINQGYVDKVLKYFNSFEKKKYAVVSNSIGGFIGGFIGEKIIQGLVWIAAFFLKKGLFYLGGLLIAYLVSIFKKVVKDYFIHK